MLPLQIDEKRFEQALKQANEKEKAKKGIGTLSEKILHATLKNYFSGENSRQEEPIGPFVADVLDKEGVIEIQTGSFSYLKKKLDYLLPLCKVRVVIPIMREKTLFWIDPGSGTLSEGRKSPKKGEPCHILGDLYGLSPYIGHENLEIYLFLYDGEEYRLADGFASEGKRGSHRVERIPLCPVNIFGVFSKYDFGLFLPYNCPKTFTSEEFSRCSKLKKRRLSAALKLLLDFDIVERKKEGKKYIYTVKTEEFCLENPL